MADHPILFSAPMVRAILAGTKTQTRRVVKPQPQHPQFGSRKMLALDDEGIDLYLHGGPLLPRAIRCPYGKPGDRLWVRETHAPQPDCWGAWDSWMQECRIGPKPVIHYKSDGGRPWVDGWRPSIHMPRWASRITLDVTGVRVERLQDISEADAQAEGCALECMTATGDDSGSAIHGPGGFAALWRSINGTGSWDANPWVWVVEFQRLKHEDNQ